MKNAGRLKNKSYNIAFGGIFSSLSIVCMILSGALSAASYCFVVLSSFCIAVIREELSGRYALAGYFVVSVLSALFVTDKEAAALFVFFFGYYPVLKLYLERTVSNRTLSFIIKTAVFNAACVAVFFLTVYLLGVPKESYMIGAHYVPWVILILANIFFCIYDRTLAVLISLYKIKFKKFFKR
ncbi:MAG: hypothetical protein VZR27_06705 [Acutalibacteraceae bacterium]|nr:hypothetical protein [Acutalibacteraceae bacterium]